MSDRKIGRDMELVLLELGERVQGLFALVDLFPESCGVYPGIGGAVGIWQAFKAAAA